MEKENKMSLKKEMLSVILKDLPNQTSADQISFFNKTTITTEEQT